MPALPLDKAGPYVAAAYLAFLAFVLVYLAIMAAKLKRIERESKELTEVVAQRARAQSNRGQLDLSDIKQPQTQISASTGSQETSTEIASTGAQRTSNANKERIATEVDSDDEEPVKVGVAP